MFVVSIRQVSVRFNFKVVKGWGLYPFHLFHCLADASLFVLIVGSAWEHPKSPVVELIKCKAQNLQKRALRIKETYYLDWNEMRAEKAKSCLSHLTSDFSGAGHN